MGIKTYKKEKLRECWNGSRNFEYLGEFLRWAFDSYVPAYMFFNTYNVLLEAIEEHDIPKSTLHRYLKDDVLEELNSEDGVNAALAWFEKKLGNKDAEYFIYKYALRKAWDDVANTFTEIILMNTDMSENDAHDIAEEGTFNWKDTLDDFPIEYTPAKVRLMSKLRLEI